MQPVLRPSQRPPQSPPVGPGPHGFTLLELLVAATIMAVIALISWRGLSSLGATRTRLEPQNGEVQAILTGFGQLERDLAQAPLSASLYALPMPAVSVVVADGHAGLQILRLAESADGSPASAVQMVFYRVQDGALQRQVTSPQHFYAADGPGALSSVNLMPQIDDIQVRVWRTGVGWISPSSVADTVNTPGIEVRLLRHDGSSLRRVFAVG